MTLKIGTRKSPLALAQAREVRARMEAAWPGMASEIVEIVTSGDKFTEMPLSEVGGKGLFTKELEEALFDGRIDIAVHSMKDMQTVLPDGLIIACMLEREDPRDKLIGEGFSSLAGLPRCAVFGSSSLRRIAHLRMVRPDIRVVPLRGNVQTRLRKLQAGEMAATMLAVAGLKRLNLNDIPGAILSIEEFLPAVAQGAIGVECRADNTKIIDLLKPLSHRDTEMAVTCERAFLRALDGSCRTPIAGYAEVSGGTVVLRGLIIRPDGSAHHATQISGPSADAEALGGQAGKALLEKAGDGFLAG